MLVDFVTSRRFAEAMFWRTCWKASRCALPAFVEFMNGRLLFDGSIWWVASAVVPLSFAAILFFYLVALKQFRKLRDLNWIKRVNPPPRPLSRSEPREHPEPMKPKHVDAPNKPVPDHALLWKETERHRQALEVPDWLPLAGLAGIGFFAILHRIVSCVGVDNPSPLTSFCVAGYTVLLGLLFVVIATQSTTVVAREREQNTLDFLLLLPVERNEILLVKWLAPWVRNRFVVFAVLAAPLICGAFGAFPFRTALILVFLPWPGLLFVSTLGLLLSVVCRRVVTANLIGIGVLVLIFALHLLLWEPFKMLCAGYINLLAQGAPFDRLDENDIWLARWLICFHQSLLLIGSLALMIAAFRLFSIRKSEIRTLAG